MQWITVFAFGAEALFACALGDAHSLESGRLSIGASPESSVGLEAHDREVDRVGNAEEHDGPGIEVGASREADVGGIRVRRALPRRARRTVGAWCFADHLGPVEVTTGRGLEVGPHPHMGLQTVTWLIEGEALHRDSLGSEQLIAPGQLNLMTAGNGVCHAEQSTLSYKGALQGIQLWIAQPERTRHGPPAFEHHPELPRLAIDENVLTVLVGDFLGASSPARHDTELVGVDLALRTHIEVPRIPSFEYALIVIEGEVRVGETTLAPGGLGYLGPSSDELAIEALEPTRLIMLGGEPFEGPILMWWNFVGRTREEIDEADRAWREDDGRFGSVASDLARIETAPPYWNGS